MDVNNGVDIASIPDWLNEVHHHKIWKGADGKWCTYVPDDSRNKHRRLVKRKLLKSVYDFLDKYYSGEPTTIKEQHMADILENYKNDFSIYKEINVWDIKTGRYLISPIGDVYSLNIKGWLDTHIKDAYGKYKGQKYVTLSTNENKSKSFSVARLTLAMFVGLPPEDMIDPTVDHIDGDSWNNYYKNLRWMERVDNSSIKQYRGIGESNSRAILSQKDVIHICNLLIKKEKTVKEIADQYKVTKSTINDIYYKRTWKYITGMFEFTY